MRGTKRKRREGVWEVRVYLGRDPVTGTEKQMSKTVYGGAKAADEVLRDLIGNRAPRTDGMGVSFGQLLDEWLADCERLDLSPTTLRAYRSQVEQTIRPALGKIPLTRLTAKHLDDVYGAMKDAGKSPKTIRNHHAIISSALHQAARWGWVRTNVAELAKPTCGSETTPRVQRPRRMPPLSWLTPERRSTQPSGATSRRTRCSTEGVATISRRRVQPSRMPRRMDLGRRGFDDCPGRSTSSRVNRPRAPMTRTGSSSRGMSGIARRAPGSTLP